LLLNLIERYRPLALSRLQEVEGKKLYYDRMLKKKSSQGASGVSLHSGNNPPVQQIRHQARQP